MRSTRASVAAIEERVAALELRLGAGGGTYRIPGADAAAGAPSPLHSVYAASPAREDPYQESSVGRSEAYHPASPVQDDPHVERSAVGQGANASWCPLLSIGLVMLHRQQNRVVLLSCLSEAVHSVATSLPCSAVSLLGTQSKVCKSVLTVEAMSVGVQLRTKAKACFRMHQPSYLCL